MEIGPNAFFFFIVIVPSAIIHEYAHALAADMQGDPTPRHAGRLTLNPMAHIDLFGTFLLPLLFLLSGVNFLFAYAKPVPYNPLNLKNKRYGAAIVGAAGPLANIVLAVVFGMIVRSMPFGPFSDFLKLVVIGNVALAVFNLLPIPPLDGSKLLYSFFPDNLQLQYTLERYGIFILLFVILFAGGAIGSLIFFVVELIL